jgi:hypothetical protein
MSTNLITNLYFVFRLLAWLLLATLEAVVGLPWLSLWWGTVWVAGLSDKKAIISLIMMAIVLASNYDLPLLVTGLVVTLLWQSRLNTRKNNWQRYLYLIAAVTVIVISSGASITLLSVVWTILSWLVLLKLAGLMQFKKIWPKQLTLPEK